MITDLVINDRNSITSFMDGSIMWINGKTDPLNLEALSDIYVSVYRSKSVPSSVQRFKKE